MFIIPSLALLSAIFVESQNQAPTDRFGGVDGYGNADLVSQLKDLDGQMYSSFKRVLSGFKLGGLQNIKLASKSALLNSIGAQRDALISGGASPSSSAVLSLDGQFRQTVESVIGAQFTSQLENALSGLRAKRDQLVRAIGAANLISDWTKYGGVQRTDLFGVSSDEGRWTGAWYGQTPQALDPLSARLAQLESSAMGIVKKVLGWKAATKGPRLIALNNQRDKLIMSGFPLVSTQVVSLKDQATAVLLDSGMSLNGPEHRQLMQIMSERDRLLHQKATS